MRIRTGCDLVHIPAFERTIRGRSGTGVLLRIFTKQELIGNPSTQTLAGIFAAKESVIKALDLAAGSWQDMEVVREEGKRPELHLAKKDRHIELSDISISHAGEYAMAVAVFIAE